jgi:hypothetical protein
MLIVLHPAYTFEIVVHDRPAPQTNFSVSHDGQPVPYNGHKFADEHNGKTGCDEAIAAVKKAIADAGLVADVRLTKFDHKA